MADAAANPLVRNLKPSAWLEAGITAPRNSWGIIVKKGGTSKTTMTLLVADAARRFGLNILINDFDPQGNSSAALGQVVKMKSAGQAALGGRELQVPDKNTMVEVIEADADGVVDEAFSLAQWPGDPSAPFARGGALTDSGFGTIGVIPCYNAFEGYSERWTIGELSRMNRALLNPPADTSVSPNARWDLVLGDLPPGGGKISRMAMKSAHYALLVTVAEKFGMMAVADTLTFLRDVRDNWDHPDLDIAGLIFTAYNPRGSVAQNQIRDMLVAQENGAQQVDVNVWNQTLPDRQVIPHSQQCEAGVSPFLAESRWREAATVACQVGEAVLLQMLDHMGHPRAAELRKLWEHAWPDKVSPMNSPWVTGSWGSD